jgi:hypothetical protein
MNRTGGTTERPYVTDPEARCPRPLLEGEYLKKYICMRIGMFQYNNVLL